MPSTALKLEPIERRPLGELVATTLRDAILSGGFKPKQRIIETEVASSMRVSRAPVREALVTLEREGLVRRTANRGAVVLELTSDDEREIRALRVAHETCAVRLVIREGAAECVRRLRDNQDRMTRAEDSAEKIALDLEFHEIIVRSANNSRLSEDWNRLRRQIQLLMVQRELRGDDTRTLTVAGHEQIVNAIEAGDVTAAIAHVQQQLDD